MIDTGSPDARERLERALPVRRLVDDAVAGGPYDSLDALAARVGAAVPTLSDAELDEVAAVLTRIETSPGAGSLSAGEQAGIARTEEGPDAGIVRGSAVYESRFGRPFLFHAAGRSPEDVLEELQRRLKNDPAEEAEDVRRQVRAIVGARLRAVFGSPA